MTDIVQSLYRLQTRIHVQGAHVCLVGA
jgi:hypothetical protein